MNRFAQIILLLAACFCPVETHAAFVYESAKEFFTSGDFNGDGIADVLVLDKTTGNARVGYMDTNGAITWSAPMVSGVENVTGCAAGTFLQNTMDALAVTAPDFNRINLVDLSNTNSTGTPTVITPNGIGPHTLVMLAAPALPPPPFNTLLAASSLNDSPAAKLEQIGFFLGVPSYSGPVGESGPFERGKAIQIDTNGPTFAVGLVRGNSDVLQILQFTNGFGAVLKRPNLPAGGAYAFGVFNGDALPQFAFYIPGQSNLTIQAVLQTNGLFSFGPAVSISFTDAVQQVFYTELGSDGAFQVQFGDGIQGVRLPGGSPVLTSVYNVGTGAAGNVFTGLVPLSGGRFVLLDAPTGSASIHAQTIQFDGSNYIQIATGNLPPVTTRGTRANVWLFQTEPFVQSNPGFVSSLTAPDWTSGLSGLPGAVTVFTETDGGASSGLGNVATNDLGAPPSGVAYGVPDQYRPDVSLFTYAAPRAAEPVSVTISPAPGVYGAPIQVSFTTQNGGDQVLYRAFSNDTWHQFTSQFTVSNDTAVLYYGTNSTPSRSRMQTANYTFSQHALGPPQPSINLDPTNTNPPPTFSTNTLVLSDIGTIFYGRRPASGDGTIWAINLDGSGETYITTGARPRVSHDGSRMAFLREGNPFNNQGNLWVRDMTTGQETRLLVNTNTIVGFDWELSNTNLILDYGCYLYSVDLNGNATQLTVSPFCNRGAPVINPVDGRIALHNLNVNAPGIYLLPPDASTSQLEPFGVTGARWPAWSPDGSLLAFVDGKPTTSVDGGRNIYVAASSGAWVSQISGFVDLTNGFPHGLIWSPDEDALVGAGSVFGFNGLWVVPLTPDFSSCDCVGGPTRLPTSPGDPIDFAGSIVVAPEQPLTTYAPGLFIRTGSNDVVVYWTTNYTNFVLEAKASTTPSSVWSPIFGPYLVNSNFFEYHEPLANLAAKKFFRLVSPPPRPVLSIVALPDELVLSWDSAFNGFVLESAAGTRASWQTISGPYTPSGNLLQYHLPTTNLQAQQLFRLHHP